jgi:hypothetical protein
LPGSVIDKTDLELPGMLVVIDEEDMSNILDGDVWVGSHHALLCPIPLKCINLEQT